MELLQNRTDRTDNSTIGDFSINDDFFCYGLEDKDRGLTSDTSPDDIQQIKVHGQTAIPTGRYRVTKYFSPKHQKDVPLLLNVPGFEGVEIHVGNFPKDMDGCLLLGSEKGTDAVLNSTPTVAEFYKQVFAVLDSEEQVWITYQ